MPVVLDVDAGGRATLTLDSPTRLNALDRDDALAALAALDTCENDRSIGCLVVAGAGRAFCAGADLGFMERIRLASPHEQVADLDLIPAFVYRLATLELPTIAAVQGAAFGGGACIALACDEVIMADNATLGLIFTSLGLPGGDSLAPWLLTRRVGSRRTWKLLASSAILDANEALALGLVDDLLPLEELLRGVNANADGYLGRSRRALATTKRQILRYEGRGAWLEAITAEENAEMLAAFNGAELVEGMAAHRERRPPVWP